MNKFLRYVTVLTVALCSLAFTACSKDDDKDDDSTGAIDNALVGTWIVDKDASNYSATGNLEGVSATAWTKLVFDEEGVCTITGEDGNVMIATYSVEGKNLILNIGGACTIKEGADIAAMYGGGIFDVTAVCNSQTYSISGNVLTLNQNFSISMDLSSFNKGKQEGTIDSHAFYNKQ